MRGRALAGLGLAFYLCGCHPAPTPRQPAGAVTLFDVDFSAPEQTTGQLVKVLPAGTEQKFPSRIPSNIFFGHPQVVSELCGLAHQPARISVATGERGFEGLEFLLDQRYGHYHLELDLCIAKLDPPPLPSQSVQVAVFLDIPEAYALGFETSGKIVVIDPVLAPETIETPRAVGTFELGKPMHFSVDVDLVKQTWRIEKDGQVLVDAPCKAYLPRALRVLVRGNPTTTAAFDNFTVWAEHDLSKGANVPSPPITGPETGPEH
jgi:hypothetical protein